MNSEPEIDWNIDDNWENKKKEKETIQYKNISSNVSSCK